MPFTNYGLDHLVAQEMSKLTQCRASEVTSRFPESKHWVSNFVLNSFVGFELSPERKRFSFMFLRRAEAAFSEYDNARCALSDFVQHFRRKPSLYFRALHHFEIAIAMMYQAYNFTKQLTGKKFFENGDNSPYERLHHIYNASRYFSTELPSDHLHAVWLTNEGIRTAKYNVSFEEMKAFLEEIGQAADSISSGTRP